MSAFSSRIAPFIAAEIAFARQAYVQGDYALEFSHLERAHVLGQGVTFHHVRVHGLMMIWGIKQRSFHEVLGQAVRMLGAATKTVFGFIPAGNTGGTNISPFQARTIPHDLQLMIKQARL